MFGWGNCCCWSFSLLFYALHTLELQLCIFFLLQQCNQTSYKKSLITLYTGKTVVIFSKYTCFEVHNFKFFYSNTTMQLNQWRREGKRQLIIMRKPLNDFSPPHERQKQKFKVFMNIEQKLGPCGESHQVLCNCLRYNFNNGCCGWRK